MIFNGLVRFKPGTADLNAIYGISPNDVWAVGDGGTILALVGSDWTPATSNTTKDLHGVTAAASNDAWAVGAGGEALHLDAMGWSVVSSNVTGKLNGVWTSAAARGWAVGEPGVILELASHPEILAVKEASGRVERSDEILARRPEGCSQR